MHRICCTILIGILMTACNSKLERYGRAYQKNGDFKSLEQAVELMEVGSDTSFVQRILGEPIDFGFDYRYLTDSIGENGCMVGAVFGIEAGKVSWKDILEICE